MNLLNNLTKSNSNKLNTSKMNKNFAREYHNPSPSVMKTRSKKLVSVSKTSSVSTVSTKTTASSTVTTYNNFEASSSLETPLFAGSIAATTEATITSATCSISLDLASLDLGEDVSSAEAELTSDDDETEVANSQQEVIELGILNELSINDETFLIGQTNKNKPKLHSLGFYYTVDRLTKAGLYHWKCEKTLTCKGRAHTVGLEAPVVLTRIHNHTQNFHRAQILTSNLEKKQRAMTSNDDPRSIIINSQLYFTEEAATQSKKIDTLRFINFYIL